MTHDELLHTISADYAHNKAIQALYEVVELHKPLVLQNCADVECCGNGNYCSHCVEEATDYYNHAYPCPTIQAITKELQ